MNRGMHVPGGLQALTHSGSPGLHLGGVSQHALRQRPPQWLLLRAVHILLECILVFYLVLVEPSNLATNFYAAEQDSILRIFKSETENSRPAILTDRPTSVLLIFV